MTAPWRAKAERLIAEMARSEFERANRLPNGQIRKRHVPYRLPSEADVLVTCLGSDDERGAKELFQRISILGITG
jgi:hypothetical protein